MRADIFKLHSLIVDDYKSYIQSFININDPEIREVVENELSKGKLWPEPLIQFNPCLWRIDNHAAENVKMKYFLSILCAGLLRDSAMNRPALLGKLGNGRSSIHY